MAVDGKTVTTPGTMVDDETQAITVDGSPIAAEKHWYVALHKPVGYVSTVSDKHAPRKVADLVHLPGRPRLVPAGRLDADSEGLLLLSNDGDFVYKVTHPSQSLGKTYQATVRGTPSDEAIRTLSKGLMLPDDDRATAPAQARKIGKGEDSGTFIVELVLGEGRNRQVRRMLDTVGHRVLRLVRTRIGPIWLGDLPVGEWRELTPGEVRLIQEGYKGSQASAKTVSGRPVRPSFDNARPPARPYNDRPSYGDRNNRPARPAQGNDRSPRPYDNARPGSGDARPPRPGGFNGGNSRPRPAGDGERGSNRPRDYGQKENRSPSPNRPQGGDRFAGSPRPPQSGGSNYRPQNNRPPSGNSDRRPTPYSDNRNNRDNGDRPPYRPNGGPGSRPQKDVNTYETRDSRSPRPRPGQDNRKSAPGRVQIHQTGVNGRVPPRREHDAPYRGGGERRGQGAGDNRRGQ